MIHDHWIFTKYKHLEDWKFEYSTHEKRKYSTMTQKKIRKTRSQDSHANFEEEKFLHWPKADSFHIVYYNLKCVEGEVIMAAHKGFFLITKRKIVIRTRHFFSEIMPSSSYNFLHWLTFITVYSSGFFR